jgi:hypothetical protein
MQDVGDGPGGAMFLVKADKGTASVFRAFYSLPRHTFSKEVLPVRKYTFILFGPQTSSCLSKPAFKSTVALYISRRIQGQMFHSFMSRSSRLLMNYF